MFHQQYPFMGLVSSRSIFSKIKRRLLREKSLSTFFSETLCTLFYFITRLRKKKPFFWVDFFKPEIFYANPDFLDGDWREE